MGSQVEAICKCGHEETFMIGGGMANFTEVCMFPCLCQDCNVIVGANLLEKSVVCPKCKCKRVVAYDQQEMCKRTGKKTVAEWNAEALGRMLTLTNGDYYCPSCGNFDLSFAEGFMLWD